MIKNIKFSLGLFITLNIKSNESVNIVIINYNNENEKFIFSSTRYIKCIQTNRINIILVRPNNQFFNIIFFDLMLSLYGII